MRFERNYNNVKITVSVGDMTQQQIGAIVNPANSLLIMGGGVAGAIRRVGGREIENEALRKRSTKTRANPSRKGNRNLGWRPESKIRHSRPDNEETSNGCRKKTISALPQMKR